MDRVDVVIVGGSFAGLSAGLQLGRARVSVKIFDTNKPRNRFASTAHGLIGHDGRTPFELRGLGRANLSHYPSAGLVDAAVDSIAQQGDTFIVQAAGQKPIAAKGIILAYGVRDRLPDIAGLTEAWGRNVMQCPYCHGYEVRDQTLGVLYTSEASLHQAKILPDWSDDVTLFTNGNTLEANALETLESRGVKLVTDPVSDLSIADGQMETVNTSAGEHALDALFLITRTEQACDLAEQLGCAFEDGPFGRFVSVDNLQQTSVPGVFAAGDLARPIHQSVWAAADGSAAGVFCHQSLLGHRNPYQKKVA
ncbi:MAG: NAD(P)/FAD-dependent oxidoreductase [Devosiaceae bacterium]|nr:NAD(P)/FAD-dependent oxidoreductase [Devosiaceae bacterium MH13]